MSVRCLPASFYSLLCEIGSHRAWGSLPIQPTLFLPSLHSAGLQARATILVTSGNRNSGLHARVIGSTLPTEPSPQVPQFAFLFCAMLQSDRPMTSRCSCAYVFIAISQNWFLLIAMR